MTAAVEEPQVDYVRLQALQNDTEIWDITRIAKELVVTKLAVSKWRWTTAQHLIETNQLDEDGNPLDDAKLATVPVRFDLLPLPDAPGSKNRRRKWYAGTIRTWAMQVGRMSQDGVAKQMPRRGRPKKSYHHE